MQSESKNKTLKILLVDDHSGLRDGIGFLLSQKNASLSFCFAGSVREAVSALCQNPEILLALIDLNLDGESGLDAIPLLRDQKKNLPVIVYTMYSDPLHIEAAVKAGIQGFITKDADVSQIEEAILSVARGKTFFNKACQEVIQTLALGKNALHLESENAITAFANYKSLSCSEKEVFELLAQKKDVAEIAELLGKKEKTVANLRSLVYQKLDIHDRLDLIEFAKQLGVIV